MASLRAALAAGHWIEKISAPWMVWRESSALAAVPQHHEYEAWHPSIPHGHYHQQQQRQQPLMHTVATSSATIKQEVVGTAGESVLRRPCSFGPQCRNERRPLGPGGVARAACRLAGRRRYAPADSAAARGCRPLISSRQQQRGSVSCIVLLR